MKCNKKNIPCSCSHCRQVLHLKQDNARLSSEAASLQEELDAIMALAASETDNNSSSSIPSRRTTTSSAGQLGSRTAAGGAAAAHRGSLWRPSTSSSSGGHGGGVCDGAPLGVDQGFSGVEADGEEMLMLQLMQDQGARPSRDETQQQQGAAGGEWSLRVGKSLSVGSRKGQGGQGGVSWQQQGGGGDRRRQREGSLLAMRPQSAYMPAKKGMEDSGGHGA